MRILQCISVVMYQIPIRVTCNAVNRNCHLPFNEQSVRHTHSFIAVERNVITICWRAAPSKYLANGAKMTSVFCKCQSRADAHSRERMYCNSIILKYFALVFLAVDKMTTHKKFGRLLVS